MVDRWWGEDTEMWGRIALHHHIAFSREPGAVYHRDSINRATERKKQKWITHLCKQDLITS